MLEEPASNLQTEVNVGFATLNARKIGVHMNLKGMAYAYIYIAAVTQLFKGSTV